MGYYVPLDESWKIRRGDPGDWKVGMLYYTAAKPAGLKDLHIIAHGASGKGNYGDAHVTFVHTKGTDHVYYQVNNGVLVSDYVLAPHGQAPIWLKFPDLRKSTEAEVQNFVAFWRDEGRLSDPPRVV